MWTGRITQSDCAEFGYQCSSCNENGGVLKIEFGLSTDDDKFVRLIVKDTGEGIPTEIRQKVFQPFFTTKK